MGIERELKMEEDMKAKESGRWKNKRECGSRKGEIKERQTKTGERKEI